MKTRWLFVFLIGCLPLGCAGRGNLPTPRAPGASTRVQEGVASWYGLEEAGRATASGEIMDPERFTAAHRSLPFGTLVRVRELATHKEVDVVINDRGPFVDNRLIDLSYGAARQIGMVEKGVADVRIEIIGLDGVLAARRWRVQVGSFTEERLARDAQVLLQSQGYSPVVLSLFEEGRRLYYRVWVGEFFERHAAESYARELSKDGYPGMVILGAATAP